MDDRIFEYQGALYPDYIRRGKSMQFIQPAAMYFCRGVGLDVGASIWPLPGAIPIDLKNGTDANDLPPGPYDYIFSSHCLEHLMEPITALRHWKTRLKPGGVLFCYLPHPDMVYWRPENCAKHKHIWEPERMAQILRALDFRDIIHSERDMAWSFCVVGFNSQAS